MREDDAGPGNAPALPTITPWLVKGFRRYVRRYVRKHFHAIRLLNGLDAEALDASSVLVVMNHASWWDPLACTRLSELIPGVAGRDHYAPIDADMLEQYGVFKRMGFFGVEPSTAAVRGFLRHGRTILAGSGAESRALWVTAQGRFADVRERPVELRPGVAHLVSHLQKQRADCVVVPMALEYAFWDQRTPELLVSFGLPRPVNPGPQPTAQHPRPVDAWNARLSADLEATMDALRDAAVSRDPDRFTTLGGGAAGVGGAYDLGRRLRAWLKLESFSPEHG